MKRSGINTLGIIFGIISVVIVIAAAALLVTQQSSRNPLDFNVNFRVRDFEDIFKGNELEESGEEVFREDYNKLRVETISGDIEITGWNEDYIKLEYIKAAPTEDHLDALVVKIEDSEDELSIKRDFSGSGISPRGEIDFTLSVPREMFEELEAKTVSGRITSTNMSENTDMELQTTSGRIQVDGSRNFEAKTISGEISFIAFGEDIVIRTTSGRINGEYRSQGGNGSIDIHSVSGAVRLAVPDTFEADVDIRSVSGSVDTDFPIQVTSSKRNSLEGSIGDGGVDVEISTTTGSINIRKASGDE